MEMPTGLPALPHQSLVDDNIVEAPADLVAEQQVGRETEPFSGWNRLRQRQVADSG